MASQRNSSEPPGEGVGRPRRQLGPLRLLRRGQRGVKATASAVPVVEVQANVSRLTGEERCVSPVILSTAAGAAPPHPTQPRATSPNAAVVAPVVAPAHPSVSANTSSPATGGAAAVRSALPASKGLRGRRSSVVSRVSTVARSVAARASTYSRESRWDSSILKIRRDRTRAMEAATSVLSPASQQHLTKMKLARVRAAKKEGPPEPVVAQAPSSHKVSTEVHSKLTRIRAAKLAASVSRQLRSHRSSTRDSTARTSMFRQSRRDAPRSSHRQGKARARFDPTLTAQSELPTCHESNAASTLYAGRNAAMGAGARGPPQAERRGRGLAGRRTRESGLVVDRATDCSEGWLSMRNPRESGLTVDRRTDLSDSALATDVSRRHRESGLVVDRRTGDEERGHRCRPTAGRATARDSDLSVDAPSGRRETGLAVDAHPGAARRHWRGRSITHRQGGTPFDGIARVSSQDELSTPPRVTFRLDSDKVESPWMQLGLELAGLELIAEEEASLDAQSKALMLAGRVRQPSASGIAKSTWLDFGQELARLSLSHEEEAALDGQSKASLRAARKLGERISRQSDSGGASWMGFGLELAELELTEEEEAELDAQSKASLRAARVVGRRESIRKSVAPSVSWMEFGLELAELDLTEEEEAELDAQSKASLRAARVVSRRKNSRKSVAPSVSWMGFGLELAELDLTEEEEVELDAQSRASLRAARVVSRRKNSRKSVAPSVSWMGFGLELAELDLTEEEEVELDAQSKASLHAARIVGRRKSSRKSVAADSSWVGFGLELAELDLTEEEEVELDAQSKASLRAARVVKRRESCRPSTTSASWVEFGLELADLDLDAEEEAALDAQSKASLRAARVVGRRESCRESVSASASWVEFGLELADLELDGEEEAALDAQSKASLRAARVVGRRESCRKSVAASASWLDFGIELADLELTREQEASLDAQSRASLRAARVVGRRESCRRSCAGNPSWPGFQMDQTELGFIEEESSMKEHSRTPLKLATDASQLQHPSASAWNDFGMQEGLELSEEETAASAQAHAVTRANAHDIAPATSWLGFGLELAALGLSADEEAALDAQARAALQSARVVKARGEPPESMVKSAWVGFGLELAALGLSADEEGALDAQAQAALHSARVVKARGEPPEVGTVKSSWVGFGLELAGLGLNADEEEALDAQARTALRSARIIKARGELPEGMVKSSWLGFGLELAGLGLNADEEEALDAQARAALLSARLLKAKLISAALSTVHARAVQGRPSLPVGASLDESIGEIDLEDEQVTFGSACTSSPRSTSLAEGLSMSAQTAVPTPSSAVTLGGTAEVIPGSSISSQGMSLEIEDGADAPSHDGWPPLPVGASLDESIGEVDSEDEQVTFGSACTASQRSTSLAEGVSMPAQAAAPSPSSAVTLSGTAEVMPGSCISSQDTPFHIQCGADAPSHDGAPSGEQAIPENAADDVDAKSSSREELDHIDNRAQDVASPPEHSAALSTVHARAVHGRPPLPVGASLDESIGEVDSEDEQVTFRSACTASRRSTSLAEGVSMPAQAAAPSPSSAVTLSGTTEVMPGSSVPSQGTPFHIQCGADAPSHDGAPSGEQAIPENAADDVDAKSSSREELDHIDNRAQDVASPPEHSAALSTVHARAVQARPPLPIGASFDESIGVVDSEDEQVTFGSASTASQRSTSLAEGVSMPAQAAAPSPSSAVTLSGTTEVMLGATISSQDTPFHIQCGADAPSHDGAPSGEQAILASAADDIDPQTAVEESPNYTQNVDVRAPSPDVASPMDELGSISAVYASVVNGPSGALMGTTSMSDSISRVMEHEITFSDSDSRPLTSCCEDYPPAAAPSSAVLEGQSHTFSDLALSRVVLSQEILTPESVIDVSAAVTEHAAYVPPFGQRDISSPSLVVPDKGSASKGRQGGFNEQEKVALVRHVKWALKNNPLVADIEKIDPHSNDIYQIIAASVLPCLFIHHVDELAIDVRALNVPGDQPLDQSSRLQNHTLCINAATSIGCGYIRSHPQQLLVSSNFVVSDFGTDLADSIALAIVLKQLSSASTRPDELRKYRIEQRAACVVDAARDAGVEAFQTIGEQAVGLKVLQPFADKLLDTNFAKSSLADWQAQFRIFEKQATFLEAVKRSQEAKATRPARQVNYLTGHPAEDDFSHQEPQDSSSGSDLLEQLAQLLAGGEVKTKGGKKEAAGKTAEDAAFVRRLVAALGGDRTAKDRDWVEANGVPGFAPPDDPRREPLHIGKVCKALLGIKVPAKCPKDPSALVGPECCRELVDGEIEK
ncbi:hypothetical protein AB1Y20_013085 [Prymnesium parvum]|uniref:Uncharacterized protein n=1 Tax=Prymnesium parvum TaxID=97485 RepID=A0AB34IN76_PRYPA